MVTISGAVGIFPCYALLLDLIFGQVEKKILINCSTLTLHNLLLEKTVQLHTCLFPSNNKCFTNPPIPQPNSLVLITLQESAQQI